MKKLFLMLSVALLAVACNKGGKDPVFNGVTLTSEKYVALSEGGTSQITFKSTADWTTVVTIGAEFTDFVTVTPSSGKAGEECKISVVADDLPDGCTGRTFSVEIVPVDKTVSATAYFGQGKFFIGIPETKTTVGIEGGKVSYHIFTNCTSYDVKKYDGPEDAFPYAPVTWDKATMTVTMDFQPNTGYDERDAYVKFYNINEISDDYVVKTYGYQDAVPCIVYSISMAAAQVDIANASVLSEAVYNGNHYVSTGKDLYKINPADGKYEKIAWPWGSGMTQKVITNDDAGNLIVCNHTAYTDAYLDGNFKLNVVTPAGVETNLIDKAAWECGGPAGAKIKVTGDVTGNAMICLPVEGIEGIGMSNTFGYWQVSAGTVGDYTTIAVTGFVGPNWGAGYWHTYANWLPNVVAVGTTPEGGFVMSGVYDENCLYDVAKDGAATKKMTATYMCGVDDCTSNYALQSIDIRTIGGVKYLAVLASPQFPSYQWPEGGSSPIVLLHKVSDIKSDADVFTSANFSKLVITDNATDLMPAGEVSLYDNGGKVGILFSDLNGGCVTAVTLDPATL